MAGETTLVSVSSQGAHANSASGGGIGEGDYDGGGISADGRFVVFDSDATNLVVGDTNNVSDIFIHDRLTKQTTRVSITSSGKQGNSYSYAPHISGNGRYVVFTSWASNLVPGDDNELVDFFVHDRQTKQTTRVNNTLKGVRPFIYFTHPNLSADGRFVVFESYADNLVAGDNNKAADIFVRDRLLNKTSRVSAAINGKEGNSDSHLPQLSADGRYVVFESAATNLVNGDNNNAVDIFVYDRQNKKNSLVSISSSGKQGNSVSSSPNISADGRFVTFLSHANNLVANDTNDADDIFIHDRQTKQTSRVSKDSKGVQGSFSSVAFPHISADGRYLTFMSFADNLVPDDTNNTGDIFVHDRLLDKAHSTDLKITTIQKPTILNINSIGAYQFAVTNQGRDIVNNARLTHLVSNGSQVLGFIPSQGNCNRYSSTSLCQFGKLLPGNKLVIFAIIKATDKPVRQDVYVNANPVDKAPGNNYLKVTTTVCHNVWF